MLLTKLSQMGITGQIHAWIEHFLTSRTMRVKVGDRYSSSTVVGSGVRQGSVLGPLLFLLYINHVVSDLSCHFRIFADDIKLYLSLGGDQLDEGVAALQRNIDLLVQTSQSWNLTLNHSKCVVIRFTARNSPLVHTGLAPYTVGGQHIRFVESHSDLGITIDRNLKFHDHIRRRVAVAGALTTNLLSSTLCREASFCYLQFLSSLQC